MGRVIGSHVPPPPETVKHTPGSGQDDGLDRGHLGCQQHRGRHYGQEWQWKRRREMMSGVQAIKNKTPLHFLAIKI